MVRIRMVTEAFRGEVTFVASLFLRMREPVSDLRRKSFFLD